MIIKSSLGFEKVINFKDMLLLKSTKKTLKSEEFLNFNNYQPKNSCPLIDEVKEDLQKRIDDFNRYDKQLAKISSVGTFHNDCCNNQYNLEQNISVIADLRDLCGKNVDCLNTINVELEKLRTDNDENRKIGNELKEHLWSLIEDLSEGNRDVVLAELTYIQSQLQYSFNYNIVYNSFKKMDNGSHIKIHEDSCKDNCSNYKHIEDLLTIGTEILYLTDYHTKVDEAHGIQSELDYWINDIVKEIQNISSDLESYKETYEKNIRKKY